MIVSRKLQREQVFRVFGGDTIRMLTADMGGELDQNPKPRDSNIP